MRIIQGSNNAHTMLLMYGAVRKGEESVTRGSTVRNICNMAVVMHAGECPVTSFEARKLNLDYAKQEWLWYLGADKMDASIEKHATMWKKLKQEDCSYYSNYGQYMFGDQHLGRKSQFEYVIQQLKKDRNSRRASISLLKQEHLFDENTDTVCTYAINFSMTGDALNMTVMMRSNDVVFGFTNDAFCFWQLYAMVWAVLKEHYPSLVAGQYVHFTNSMHVYDRHYDMLHKICTTHNGGHYKVVVPWPTATEALELFKTKGKGGSGAYTEWLKAKS